MTSETTALTTTTKTKKKYIFHLKHIKEADIDIKYGFQIAFNLSRKVIPDDRTPISQLQQTIKSSDSTMVQKIHRVVPLSTTTTNMNNTHVHEPSSTWVSKLAHTNHTTNTMRNVTQPVQFTYFDESKRDHQCIVTMSSVPEPVKTKTTCISDEEMSSVNRIFTDMIKKESIYFMDGQDSHLHCFWCRSPFSGYPIGIPTQYQGHRILRSYFSEITKNHYCLRENILQSTLLEKFPELKQNSSLSTLSMILRHVYFMDGVFCSFSCAYAFINDNKHNPLYKYSENLLLELYYQHFGNEAVGLEAAPSWRLLKDYGGHLTIEEYRRNFSKVDYHHVEQVVFPNFIDMKPIGHIFEKLVHI